MTGPTKASITDPEALRLLELEKASGRGKQLGRIATSIILAVLGAKHGNGYAPTSATQTPANKELVPA